MKYSIKGRFFKITSIFLIFIFIFSNKPVWAARSNAGGGKIAKFDWGQFALNVGINLGTMALGSIAQGGISSLSFTNILHGYSTFVATSEVGGAVGAIGSYRECKPAFTFLISTIATSAISSFLNPEIALGMPTKDDFVSKYADIPIKNPVDHLQFSTMLKGAAIGALEGFAEGGVIYLMDKKRINKGENLSPLAQIAGRTAGMMATGFGRELFNPAPNIVGTYKSEFHLEDNTYTYTKILETNKNVLGDDRLGKTLNHDEFMKEYGSNNFMKQFDGELIKVIELHPKKHLFRASVVKTLDQWPALLSQYIDIIATQNLPEDKQYLAPLIEGITQAVTYPIFQNIADVHGLKPSLYVGGRDYVVANRIDYKNYVLQTGLGQYMTKQAEELSWIRDKVEKEAKERNLSSEEKYNLYAKEIQEKYPEVKIPKFSEISPEKLSVGKLNEEDIIKFAGKTKEEWEVLPPLMQEKILKE
jgi:hypothetical protein